MGELETDKLYAGKNYKNKERVSNVPHCGVKKSRQILS
jgi:hypothetical protein